ncbi:hypothetical protein OSSY52_03170 [Tepiditoga spiralis]|uniref:BioF2-like acetyltransferase domain-containing protein n=1 Tax=Tepiditoga spiralis TaxID=2108365 RepID=A0A7G1G4P0_9BACT|nr:GNAT family N-acetyltransferase [Tepiditoga spiralis]BBE30176.1 hypothetical protein OSSY52_03170 [Tepiditoga spiralis]
MMVRLLKESEKNKWNNFVQNSNQGSIFCSYEWIKTVTNNDFKILTYEENRNVIAGLPLPFINSKNIKMPKLTQKLGVLFDNFENMKYNKRLEKEKKIIYEFLNEIKGKYKSFYMNFDWHFDNWLPFYWQGFKQTTRYTYVIDFEKGIDNIWKELDQNTRNTIKKAKKNNIKVVESFDIKEFYKFNKMTFSRQSMNIPYSFEYVEKIYTNLKNNIKIFKTIDEKGNIHAMNFYIQDNKAVYYLMSGSDPKFRKYSSQNLLQWEAIKYYSSKVRYFDFEGSMIESIESNFRKFGTIQKQYFSIYTADFNYYLKSLIKYILGRS